LLAIICFYQDTNIQVGQVRLMRGFSLGGYAPARGMTVFTVKPAINRNTTDSAAGQREGNRLSEAERRIERQDVS
jgi:hypothetical protein